MQEESPGDEEEEEKVDEGREGKEEEEKESSRMETESQETTVTTTTDTTEVTEVKEEGIGIFAGDSVTCRCTTKRNISVLETFRGINCIKIHVFEICE